MLSTGFHRHQHLPAGCRHVACKAMPINMATYCRLMLLGVEACLCMMPVWSSRDQSWLLSCACFLQSCSLQSCLNAAGGLAGLGRSME